MNRTTKINILAYASEPDKNYKYEERKEAAKARMEETDESK